MTRLRHRQLTVDGEGDVPSKKPLIHVHSGVEKALLPLVPPSRMPLVTYAYLKMYPAPKSCHRWLLNADQIAMPSSATGAADVAGTCTSTGICPRLNAAEDRGCGRRGCGDGIVLCRSSKQRKQ